MKQILLCRGSFSFNNYSLLRVLTIAVMFAINTISAQLCVLAQSVPKQTESNNLYVPPVLKAPYTLVFAVRVEKFGSQMKGDMPLKLQRNGTLTLSSDGSKILYLVKFGKWSEVIICDSITNVEYFYKNSDYNAVIQPGVKSGLSRMFLLPMPGVGYDFYPLFQSFQYFGVGPSHANMAAIGAVSAVTDGIIQGMLYQDALVEINRDANPITMKSCRLIVTDHPALALDIWQFSKYRMLGSVPIAGLINHVLNTSSVPGTWPPSSLRRDEDIDYTLLSASNRALPQRQYNLRSYLPAGLVVSDARKHP